MRPREIITPVVLVVTALAAGLAAGSPALASGTARRDGGRPVARRSASGGHRIDLDHLFANTHPQKRASPPASAGFGRASAAVHETWPSGSHVRAAAAPRRAPGPVTAVRDPRIARPRLVRSAVDHIRAWRMRKPALREFRRYVRSASVVESGHTISGPAIYREEKKRETVNVARGTMWAAAIVGVAQFVLMAHGNPPMGLGGASSFAAATLAWSNQHSKIQKARGTTIHRLMDSAETPVPEGAIDRWVAAGLFRFGDLHP